MMILFELYCEKHNQQPLYINVLLPHCVPNFGNILVKWQFISEMFEWAMLSSAGGFLFFQSLIWEGELCNLTDANVSLGMKSEMDSVCGEI